MYCWMLSPKALFQRVPSRPLVESTMFGQAGSACDQYAQANARLLRRGGYLIGLTEGFSSLAESLGGSGISWLPSLVLRAAATSGSSAAARADFIFASRAISSSFARS